MWSSFRSDFYNCLTARADAIFDLTGALLRVDGRSRLWSTWHGARSPARAGCALRRLELRPGRGGLTARRAKAPRRARSLSCRRPSPALGGLLRRRKQHELGDLSSGSAARARTTPSSDGDSSGALRPWPKSRGVHRAGADGAALAKPIGGYRHRPATADHPHRHQPPENRLRSHQGSRRLKLWL